LEHLSAVHARDERSVTSKPNSNGKEVTKMELRMEDMKLEIEAVDLGDLDMLEEDIVPCTGCGCHDCK
jgi:hypothetical protein